MVFVRTFVLCIVAASMLPRAHIRPKHRRGIHASSVGCRRWGAVPGVNVSTMCIYLYMFSCSRLFTEVAASSVQHPEDSLPSLLIRLGDEGGISVHMGGLVDSAAYVLFITVYQSSTVLLSTSRSDLTAPPGHDHAVTLLNLPSGVTGKIRVDAELHDMFQGLSDDEALLARINMVLEVTPPSACSFTFSLQGKRCPQLDDWGGGATDEASCRRACCMEAIDSGTCFAWSWHSGSGQCYHGYQQHLDVASLCVDDASVNGELGLHGNLWEGQNTIHAQGVSPTRKVALKSCVWVPDEHTGKRDLHCPDPESSGYLAKNTSSFPGYNWWYDPTQPNALHYFHLDALYSVEYHGEDHVTGSVVETYATAALAYCAHLLGRKCNEVVDVGAARCYFSEGMRRLGANVTSVEGTTAGVNACRQRADPGTVLQKDLRMPLGLHRRFDLATCTEVAEHIEPPFAGTLVHSLTEAADVVWFSSEAPKWVLDNDDHLHHSNEQPQVSSSWPVCV